MFAGVVSVLVLAYLVSISHQAETGYTVSIDTIGQCKSYSPADNNVNSSVTCEKNRPFLADTYLSTTNVGGSLIILGSDDSKSIVFDGDQFGIPINNKKRMYSRGIDIGRPDYVKIHIEEPAFLQYNQDSRPQYWIDNVQVKKKKSAFEFVIGKFLAPGTYEFPCSRSWRIPVAEESDAALIVTKTSKTGSGGTNGNVYIEIFGTDNIYECGGPRNGVKSNPLGLNNVWVGKGNANDFQTGATDTFNLTSETFKDLVTPSDIFIKVNGIISKKDLTLDWVNVTYNGVLYHYPGPTTFRANNRDKGKYMSCAPELTRAVANSEFV